MHNRKCTVAFHPKERFEHMCKRLSLSVLKLTSSMVHLRLRIAKESHHIQIKNLIYNKLGTDHT